MAITGLKPQLAYSDISVLLKKYSDSAAASDYAKSSIGACLKTGIITGRSSTALVPKDYITRAEVAVVVKRLLQKSDLI
ncbi:MAG: S-layer homology domain-containing protein [Oscillospiraceae bacterium]|nr:S-layer homology domain-containing protein [Oscillospiraceae bacterium]